MTDPAVNSLRQGAARAYAELLRRRHPNATVEVVIEGDGGPVETVAEAGPGEICGLMPSGDQAHTARHRPSPLRHPHDAKRAA